MIVRFATGNPGKIKEAEGILGIEVLPVGLEIDEIQSLDPAEVASKKAEAYWRKVQKPLFVEDVSLIFRHLGALPGPYIDDFLKNFGNEGLASLIPDKENRQAVAITTLVFVDEKGASHVFQGRIEGTIAKGPKGEGGFGWDPIFIPKGASKTFGEMGLEEKNMYSMRAKAMAKFKRWLSAEGYIK
jgi:non-canonical purine NTP pyrophosphatase (RdgB/HAM1 family)